MIEVRTAGSRGRETAISSEPPNWAVMPSSASQNRLDGPGVSSSVPSAMPTPAADTAVAAVATVTGPAGRRRSRPTPRMTSR